MGWTIVLGGIYLALACWWISRWKRIRPADLSTRLLIVLFLSRVAMAWCYGWIHQRYYTGFNDSWRYFHRAVELVSWWHRDSQGLSQYIRMRLDYLLYHDFFGVYHTFWQSSGNYVMMLLQVLFNVFSRSSYYVNCIFFSVLTFPGWLRYMQLYRVTAGMSARASLLWFHLPGIWFWFSGMHKDALLFLCLSLLGYHTHQLLEKGFTSSVKATFRLSDGIWILLSLIGILLLKNFLLLLVLPAWLAWVCSIYLNNKWPYLRQRFTRGWLFAYCLAGWLVIGLVLIWTFRLHPLQVVAERQQAFYRVGVELGAHSVLPPIPLMPGWISVLKALPHAWWRVLALPNPSPLHPMLQIAVQGNNLLFLVLLFAGIWIYGRTWPRAHPWLLFTYWLAVVYLLLMGYTVCIAGAMVRYRALAEFFLTAPGIQALSKKYFKKNNI